MEQVRFENHLGEKLAGTLHSPARFSGRGAVLCHCFTCSRNIRLLSDLASALSEAGFLALRFDFSGNGASEGAFTDSTCTKQVLEAGAALAFLKARGARGAVLLGHSLGGVAALIAASRNPEVTGLVTVASRLSALTPGRFLAGDARAAFDELGLAPFVSRGRELTLTREFFEDAERYDLRRILAELGRPVLWVTAGADEILQPQFPEGSAAPPGLSLFTIPGADHMLSAPEHRAALVGRVIEWLEQTGQADSAEALLT